MKKFHMIHCQTLVKEYLRIFLNIFLIIQIYLIISKFSQCLYKSKYFKSH